MSKAPPGTVIAAGFGSALAAGLTQLGLAYGLAIVMWRDASATEWSSHLGWTAWLTAVSVVIGTLVSSRLNADIGTRIISALAACIGGFVVAPLVAVPALRVAEGGFAVAPFASAGIGAVAGLIAAALALTWRSVRINVAASIVVTWVIAALAAFVPLGGARDEVIELGMWGSWPALVPELAPPLLAASVIIGATSAWLAGPSFGAQHRITAISGMTGPLLIAAAYGAATQPSVGAELNWTGIWVGGYAAVAGLLGSLLVAALRGTPATNTSPPAPPKTSPREDDEQPTATVAMPADGANVSPYVSDHAYDETYDPAVFGEFAQEPVTDTDGSVPRVPRQAGPAEEMDDWVSELKDDNAFVEQREREEAARNAKDDDSVDEEKPKPKKKRRPKRKKQDKPEASEESDTDETD